MESRDLELGNPQNLGISCREGGKGGSRAEGEPQFCHFGNWKIGEYQEQSWSGVCSRCVKFEASTGLSVLMSRRAAEYWESRAQDRNPGWRPNHGSELGTRCGKGCGTESWDGWRKSPCRGMRRETQGGGWKTLELKKHQTRWE